jgi:hypothetical protein
MSEDLEYALVEKLNCKYGLISVQGDDLWVATRTSIKQKQKWEQVPVEIGSDPFELLGAELCVIRMT